MGLVQNKPLDSKFPSCCDVIYIKYIENPEGYRTLFKQMFKVAFPDAIEEFAQAIKIGQWPNAN